MYSATGGALLPEALRLRRHHFLGACGWRALLTIPSASTACRHPSVTYLAIERLMRIAVTEATGLIGRTLVAEPATDLSVLVSRPNVLGMPPFGMLDR